MNNYLEELLKPTPLALIKIKESWNYLSLEEKIVILKSLLRVGEEGKIELCHHQIDELRDFIFNDENPYIRYLIAKQVISLRDEAQFQKILLDKSALVRAVAEKSETGLANKDRTLEESFWELSQTSRIASLFCEYYLSSYSRRFPELLDYAIKKLLPKKEISIQELQDVIQQFIYSLKEYLSRLERSEEEDFLWDSWHFQKYLESLWKVTFIAPDKLGFQLIEGLPGDYFCRSVIPLENIEKISKEKLCHLLSRDEITLNDLRRKIYNQKPSKKNEALRTAAISSFYFKLEDSDLEKLFNENNSSKDIMRHLKDLEILANYCEGATLAQRQAIITLRKRNADLANELLENRVQKLLEIGDSFAPDLAGKDSYIFSEELLDWRIYAFTYRLVDGNLPRDFEFLENDIVIDDRWATYQNIRSTIVDMPELHIDLPVLHIGDKSYPEEVDELSQTIEEKLEIDTAYISQHFASLSSYIKSIEKELVFMLVIIIALQIVLIY